MSRLNFRTKKAFHPIGSVSSSLENSWRMDELLRITISRRNLPFTWYFDFEEDSRPTTATTGLNVRNTNFTETELDRSVTYQLRYILSISIG